MSGREYSKADTPSEWSRIAPTVGQVLEFSLRASSLMCFENAWGAVLIEGLGAGGDGHYIVRGRLPGVEEFEGREIVTSDLPAEGLTIHLCGEEMCMDDDVAFVHCWRVPLWDLADFPGKYVGAEGQKLLKARAKARGRAKKVADTSPEEGDRKAPAGKKADPGKGKPEKAKGAEPKRGSKAAPKKTGGGEGVTDSDGKREMLRGRL